MWQSVGVRDNGTQLQSAHKLLLTDKVLTVKHARVVRVIDLMKQLRFLSEYFRLVIVDFELKANDAAIESLVDVDTSDAFVWLQFYIVRFDIDKALTIAMLLIVLAIPRKTGRFREGLIHRLLSPEYYLLLIAYL